MALTQEDILKLKRAPWGAIKHYKYIRDLCYEVWLVDKDIDYLINQPNFIFYYHKDRKLLEKTSFFDLAGADTSVHLMTSLLDHVYTYLPTHTRVEDAIKAVKAELAAALILSNSIEKAFKDFQLTDYSNNKYHFELTNMSYETFAPSFLISGQGTLLYYAISLDYRTWATTSIRMGSVHRLNIHDIENIKYESLQNLINNNILVEAGVSIGNQNSLLQSTIGNFPQEIKKELKKQCNA